MNMPQEPKPSPWRGLPAGIWALGLVSMLMDISSEMIHALLPVYLTVGLGATALAVALLLASVIAGGLWQWIGSEATFLAGASFAAIAALGLLPLRHKLA